MCSISYLAITIVVQLDILILVYDYFIYNVVRGLGTNSPVVISESRNALSYEVFFIIIFFIIFFISVLIVMSSPSQT